MSLSDFEVLKKLGDGAYSTVYQVKRKTDSQIYALKKVRMASLKPKEKRNALNEVRIMASIKHPNVISYKEAFFDDESGSLCLIMEYADSGDLYQKILTYQKKGCYLSENYIWNIFIQLLRGLKALHDLSILHRDLKSANVFLNKDGTVKLGDMNVSKVAKDGLLYTQTGTPYYASPEVWRDQPYDAKSDMWSLGCVLYEAITLKPPFRAEDMNGLFQKVVKGEYPPIPRTFSKDLANTLGQLLQVEPSRRPSCEVILRSSLLQRHIAEKYTETESLHENSLLSSIKLPKNIKLITDFLPKPNYRDIRSNFSEPIPSSEKTPSKSPSKSKFSTNRSYLTQDPEEKKVSSLSPTEKNHNIFSPKRYREILKESYGALKLPKIRYPVKGIIHHIKIKRNPDDIFSTRSLPLQRGAHERLERIKEVYLKKAAPRLGLSPDPRTPIKVSYKPTSWT